ncbi:hypothetical protein P7C70_g2305, partial [Phenoliferia sp. Uapishka_3]
MRRYADYRQEFDATLPTYVSAPHLAQRWRLQWETGMIQVEGHVVPPCIMQVFDLFAMVWGYDTTSLLEELNDAVANGHLGGHIKREYVRRWTPAEVAVMMGEHDFDPQTGISHNLPRDVAVVLCAVARLYGGDLEEMLHHLRTQGNPPGGESPFADSGKSQSSGLLSASNTQFSFDTSTADGGWEVTLPPCEFWGKVKVGGVKGVHRVHSKETSDRVGVQKPKVNEK